MVGIILISENKEGREMLKTVKRLLGKTDGIKTVMLSHKFSPERMKRELAKTIQSFNGTEGILLLTDIYGSTQCNVCMSFVKKGVVELFTGFNLPVVIKLATLNKQIHFKKLVPIAENYGRSHFMHITKK